MLDQVFEEISRTYTADLKLPNASTGFPALDCLTTGLVDGSLVVITGRPATGKSALALDIARSLLEDKSKTTAIISLDMSTVQILYRLKIAGGTDFQNASNLHICETPIMTVADIHEICRNISNLGAIIIDYYQLIDDPAYHTNQANRIGIARNHISRDLKILAKTWNVPVICISTMGRSYDNSRFTMDDLRIFGALQQDADLIIILHRADLSERNECIVAKNRYGDLGTVMLVWDKNSCSYSEAQ